MEAVPSLQKPGPWPRPAANLTRQPTAGPSGCVGDSHLGRQAQEGFLVQFLGQGLGPIAAPAVPVDCMSKRIVPVSASGRLSSRSDEILGQGQLVGVGPGLEESWAIRSQSIPTLSRHMTS